MNPERDRRKGIGLGLCIVQRSCQLLKHRVSLTSQLGKGSRFSVEVPLVSTPPLDRDRVIVAAPDQAAWSGLRVLVIEVDALPWEVC